MKRIYLNDKIPIPNINNYKISIYLNSKDYTYFKKEAEKIGLSVSSYARMSLIELKNKGGKNAKNK